MQSLLKIALATILWLGILAATPRASEPWEGVDTTVVEKFAREAGHPPRTPYINTEQGDLLLFLFLLSGTAGGFIAGYTFRALFPPKAKAAAQGGSGDEAASESVPCGNAAQDGSHG
jgi:hypothetical protein